MNFLSFFSSPANHAARRAAAAAAMPPEPTTVPAPPLYPAAKRPPTQAMMCEAYFSGCNEFYSAPFHLGFRQAAAVLLGGPAVAVPPMEIPSAAYDAFKYGAEEAKEYWMSAEWRALAA